MDTTQLWKEALETIKVSVSGSNFSTWFSKTHIASIKSMGDELQMVEVGCPSTFVADGIEKRYIFLIQETLNQITKLKNELTFSVKQLPANGKHTDNEPLFTYQEEKTDYVQNDLEILRKARIRPGFTFENFAVSTSNQMAWAAADAISKNPGSAYNPLFLWGGVGVGKTHLMLAIGHDMLKKDKSAKVLYCMGEEFTTEIVEAIRNKDTLSFKKRYRNLNLLMLDDVQFIAGKNTVQEEFFHTFNTLLREGGQVILTSDRPPSEIPKLEDRLRNRFEAGLIIDISPPDFELRAAIAINKAEEKGESLPMEVAQAIAANIDNPRRIEGFLTRLFTENSGLGHLITVDMVNKLLNKTGNLTEEQIQSPVRAAKPQAVIDRVSEYYSISKRKLLGSGRTQQIVLPRQLLMYLLRIEMGISLAETGRLIGGRDHTTIMHGVAKITDALSTNNTLKTDLMGIKKVLSG